MAVVHKIYSISIVLTVSFISTNCAECGIQSLHFLHAVIQCKRMHFLRHLKIEEHFLGSLSISVMMDVMISYETLHIL